MLLSPVGFPQQTSAILCKPIFLHLNAVFSGLRPIRE
jgi:hypothetical protein